MAQEFTINSSAIESKINSLLPSQGGFGAGIDFSASTMVIPIVDLTETAEGSGLREDLQQSFSHGSITPFTVNGSTTTVVNTTGYYRVFGNVNGTALSGANRSVEFRLNDGTTDKVIQKVNLNATSGIPQISNFDFNVFLSAGDSLIINSSNANIYAEGCTRQIATIDGTLVNPI